MFPMIEPYQSRRGRAAVALLLAAMPAAQASAQAFDQTDDVAALMRNHRVRERLYRSRPAGRWHFQVDTNAGRDFVLAECTRSSCGAFYRRPPVRLTILSMVDRPLMLRVTREDCASASETWRSTGIVRDVRRLPISLADARSVFGILVDKAGKAARSNCLARIDVAAARVIPVLSLLRGHFAFRERGALGVVTR